MMAALPAALGAPLGAHGPRSALKPPTGARPARRPLAHRRAGAVQVHASAAAATTQQLAFWLAGVDKAAAAAPGASGLVASRAVKAGEQLFAVPESAWITAEMATDAPVIGPHLAG